MSPHSNIIQDDGMRPAPRRVRRFARRSGPCAAGVAVVAATALLGCGIESSADAASASTEAPASAPVVRFAVKGDWGWGGPEQRRVTARLCAEHRIHPFRFLLTTGDNFYQPDGVANSANFTVPGDVSPAWACGGGPPGATTTSAGTPPPPCWGAGGAGSPS